MPTNLGPLVGQTTTSPRKPPTAHPRTPTRGTSEMVPRMLLGRASIIGSSVDPIPSKSLPRTRRECRAFPGEWSWSLRWMQASPLPGISASAQLQSSPGRWPDSPSSELWSQRVASLFCDNGAGGRRGPSCPRGQSGFHRRSGWAGPRGNRTSVLEWDLEPWKRMRVFQAAYLGESRHY